MSILLNESYSNETTPIWALASNSGQNWSTFPAVSNVDMAGNILTDSTNTLNIGVGINTYNGINMNDASIVNVGQISTNRDYGSSIGNGRLPLCSYGWYPDISASAPQLDVYDNPYNINSTLESGEITNGEWFVAQYISDVGILNFRLTMPYNFVLSNSGQQIDLAFSMYVVLTNEAGSSTVGDVFNSSTPMIFNSNNFYSEFGNSYMSGVYVDTFQFDPDYPFNLQRNSMNIQIFTNVLSPSIGSTTITGSASATTECVADPND